MTALVSLVGTPTSSVHRSLQRDTVIVMSRELRPVLHDPFPWSSA